MRLITEGCSMKEIAFHICLLRLEHEELSFMEESDFSSVRVFGKIP